MKIRKILVILCLLLVGCASKPSTPDGTMHAFFSAFKSFNFNKMNDFLEQPIDEITQDDFKAFIDYTNSTKTTKEVMSILKNMEIDWIAIDSQIDTVMYEVSITYYNTIELKENYLEYFIQAFEDHANPEIYDQRIQEAYHQAYMRAKPSLTKTFEVTCVKSGNTWVLLDGSNLFTAFTKSIKTQIYLLGY